jgi:hypothetical protein
MLDIESSTTLAGELTSTNTITDPNKLESETKETLIDFEKRLLKTMICVRIFNFNLILLSHYIFLVQCESKLVVVF